MFTSRNDELHTSHDNATAAAPKYCVLAERSEGSCTVPCGSSQASVLMAGSRGAKLFVRSANVFARIGFLQSGHLRKRAAKAVSA
jgi:hypothetical protein